MPIIAPASKSYSLRILLMMVLCAGFGAWFTYDGWVTYPRNNDHVVARVLHDPKGEEYNNLETFKRWPGYQHATADQISVMDDVTKKSGDDDWKTAHDIFTQRLMGVSVLILTVGVLLWYLRYRGRRALADETGLSPERGVMIPWGAITVVDNTRWQKSGIVTVTWKEPGGGERTSKLDEYDLDHLVPVLMELEKHATNATFIPAPGDEAAKAPTEG